MKNIFKKLTLISLMMSLSIVGSFAVPAKDTTLKATPTTIVINGQEVVLKTISENGQLFVAIDELAPAINMSFDDNEEKPLLNDELIETSDVKKVQLTYSGRVISNNSVGDEWYYAIKVKEYTYDGSGPVPIIDLTGDNIPVELIVYEYDKSKSDYGYQSVVIPYSELLKGQPLTYTNQITVTENGGRYTGNQAVIEFILVATPL